MENIEEIMKKAKEAAQEKNLPYTGALTPQSAYALLQHEPRAKLVDVRTRAEWEWVGRVTESLEIEWNQWPGGTRNPDFAASLSAAVPDKNTPLLFLCRGGVRSHAAATLANELGYRNVFNVLEGFEGEKDQRGHRNSINGWRFRGLPWVQG